MDVLSFGPSRLFNFILFLPEVPIRTSMTKGVSNVFRFFQIESTRSFTCLILDLLIKAF